VPRLTAGVYESVADLPSGFSIGDQGAMPYPQSVLVVPPTHFDVIDVKNPFMTGRTGTVDKSIARLQWNELKAAFEKAGARVRELAPLPGCEDMVFCANPAFLGIDDSGRKICAPSRMTYPSRRAEVAAMVAWCEAEGYDIVRMGDGDLRFEGGGDAIWHPGRRLIWGGYGWRSDRDTYEPLAAAFGAPVFLIKLASPTYYHLDTCFCPIDERTVIVHSPAIADEGMQLVRRTFERIIEVDAVQAEAFACNGAPLFGRAVVLDHRAAQTGLRLRQAGYDVLEVDTGEFLKSGGSAYCMKCMVF
jgi:arginine dihydrolase